MLKLSRFIYYILIIIFISCKKDVSVISNIPEITFVSVHPEQVKEFKDSIRFTLSYRDGDGDLGENNSDVKNLFLTDNRNGVTYKYRIQQLAPDGAKITIEGKLNVVLNNTGITDNSTNQTYTYSIYIIDRANHKSNTITSQPVTVSK